MLGSKCLITVAVFILNGLFANKVNGKVIDRCEFVHEIKRFRPQIDYHALNTWICIAQNTNFNISSRYIDRSGVGYHGIFQISDMNWCSNNAAEQRACKLNCDQLRNGNFEDDFECLDIIYSEHLRIYGNGFSAWPVYNTHCNEGHDLINDCLNDGTKDKVSSEFGKISTSRTKSVTETRKMHKIYERCELARELYSVHNLPFEQIARWLCIAKYESNYNASGIGRLNADANGDHGLFQISDIYWCSPPGRGWVCGLSCAKSGNADISDDVKCMKKMYDEHQRLSGDGFNAWSVYARHCKHDVDHFIAGCFENDDNYNDIIIHEPAISAPSKLTKEVTTTSQSKVYSRCELAQELRYKHNVPKDQIHTWICIAYSLTQLNTSIESANSFDGTNSFGLFQINSAFWCSNDGTSGKGCQINCGNLIDTDITDDIQCALKIFDEYKRLFGDGFQAWTSYENYCKYETTESIRGCLDSDVGSRFGAASIKETKFKASEHHKTKPKPKSMGKMYERCELAKELRYVHNVPLNEIPAYVCIAQYQSNLVTWAVQANEHGLFQISDRYWCSLYGSGMICDIPCSHLEDSDIADDVRCARKIHSIHSRLNGDGFTAWAAYEPYCKGQTQFTTDCFPNDQITQTIPSMNRNALSNAVTKKPSPANKKGKIFNRCELATELLVKYKIPKKHIHTWTCIAKHESNFDTAAVGRLNADGSGDHGLFQISDIYWCTIDGPKGKSCNAKCSDFEDSDISDDVTCVKSIFDEHQRLFGNGFNAWAVYEPHCRHKTSSYISDCFPDDVDFKANDIVTQKSITSIRTSAIDRGRTYERCELAKELRYRHNIPIEKIADWVCIAIFQANLDTTTQGAQESGIFQISHEYWCSNNGTKGKGCNIECSDLEDSDITDDVQCAQHIYNIHRHSGNGFSAWSAYEPFCSAGKSAQYIFGCFDDFSTSSVHRTVHDVITGFVNRFKPIENKLQQIHNPVHKGKVYDRCELALELRYKHNMPSNQIHTWVCIAEKESSFHTRAVGRLNADGSGDHGLFQISDIYWCTIDGPKGKGCNAKCSEFEDSDISDDVACVRSIFDEHQRLFGNGFHAWATYEPHCKSIASSHIDECFSTAQNEIVTTENKLASISAAFIPSIATTTTKGSQKRTSSPTTTQKVTQPFTLTTKPTIFSSTTQIPSTTLTTKQSSLVYSTTSRRSRIPATSKTNTETTSSNRLKIFDLYLSQYSTKKPQTYDIPQFTSIASPIRQPITLANPYTARFSTTTPIPDFLDTNRDSKSSKYSLGLPLSPITATNKQPEYYRNFFQSQIARVMNGRNLTSQNSAYNFNYLPIVSTSELSTSTVSTTKRPRTLFRYSFTGTTLPKSQPIQPVPFNSPFQV